LHRQLANEIELDDGRRGLLLSASKEIEPGARAMLLLAEGLFRLDVLVHGDSLQTFIRNFSSAPLEIQGEADTLGGISAASGAAAAFSPGRADLGFTLGPVSDQVLVRVTIATLNFADRGAVRVSAQAIVSQASAS
jgi:hypothetical protein